MILTKTQAISQFLKTQRVKVDLYTPQMEVQVNTIAGEVLSRKPLVYTDGNNEWSPFRIPFNPKEPHYNDQVLNWDISKFALAIGTTGWDWYNRVSRWVGFDFDSSVSHVRGLSDLELDGIRDRVSGVPWITVRRSKSGKGLHLYVHFHKAIHTANHTEHAALGRAVLYQLSALLNFDFKTKVDTCGGVLWVWHREATEERGSFRLIKQGVPLETIPEWQQFVTAKAKAKVPSKVVDDNAALDQLTSRIKTNKLDDSHRRLLDWFANQPVLWWWDADRNMLVSHTHDLKRAHAELNLLGIFETNARGKDTPNDQNCFAFPAANGAWTVRRHSIGTSEHKYWFADNAGWTTCYFNRLPTLDIAARTQGGVRTKSGGFKFQTLEEAAAALQSVGASIEVPDSVKARSTSLAYTKDRDIVISVEKQADDPTPEGFYKGRSVWEQVIEVNLEEPIDPPDHLLRHVVGLGKSEWVLLSRGDWVPKEKGDVKDALIAMGYKSSDLSVIFGNSIFTHWSLVCIPFAEEYPGDRTWNKEAPQLAFVPAPGSHPSWDSVLANVGRYLEVGSSQWCLTNGIVTGADYLRLWVASMLRYPYEPLPYLFLHGDQDSGKSILHEALYLLFREGRGYVRAETALTSTSGFNGELEGAVLCVIEELDLGKSAKVNDRVKDWVTAKHLNIRALYTQPYTAPNSTHWIQVANDASYCPIFAGDTRITVIYVERPAVIIPKKQLLQQLLDEAPAFINTLMKVTIPESDSRLNIPVINSGMKEDITYKNELETFIETKCAYEEGAIVSAPAFIKKFVASLGGIRGDWSDQAIFSKLNPGRFPRGKINNALYLGNMRLIDEETIKVKEGKLVRDVTGRLG